MRGILKSLWAGAKTRWRHGRAWCRDGAPLWVWLVVAALLFGFAYLLPAPLLGEPIELADRLRWSGLLFQFAGLATVVVGLNLSRQVFDQNSIWKAIVAWFAQARYMVVPPKDIEATLNARGLASMAFVGEATLSTRNGSSIEDRVEQLEAELRRLQKRLAETNKDVRMLQSDTNEKIDKERDERRSEDQKIGKRLETAAIGGIHLELAGLAYLIVGVTMTSVPNETAAALNWIFSA